MFLFLVTVFFIVLFLFKIGDCAPEKNSETWQAAKSKGTENRFNFLTGIRFIAQQWWAQPGAFIKAISFKSVTESLPQPYCALNQADFLGIKQAVWSLGFTVILISLWVTDVGILDSARNLLMLLSVVLLPDIYLLNRRRLLQIQYGKEVPYFLDLLTLTLQGGGNLEQALQATTQNYQSQLSLVLSKKLKELHWGRSLEAIFKDLNFEVHDEDFQHFLSSVVRAKKLGVSLSQTLIIQSELLRTRRRQKAEELSRTASVKMSIPLVLFIFPALLIIYIGPGILQLLART
jgi:Flp pilus assembly protein TadB